MYVTPETRSALPKHICCEQKLLLPSGLELMSESSESGALSLSSAARHIDFHLLRSLLCRSRSAFHSAFTTHTRTHELRSYIHIGPITHDS